MNESASVYLPWQPFYWCNDNGKTFPYSCLPPRHQQAVWATTKIIGNLLTQIKE